MRAERRISIARLALAVAGALVVLLAVAVGVWYTSWASARDQIRTGTIAAAGLQAPVTIDRDAHGIAHVRATTLDDVYFGEGYAMAADRLFQMDLLRRYVAGELSEVLGRLTIDADRDARLIRPRELARHGYAAMTQDERSAVDAFTRGVNAAIHSEPLPPEFRALVYRPKPWLPEDSILVGLATIVDLTHDWNDILVRQRVNDALGMRGAEALNPLSDPVYDSPLQGTIPPITCKPPLRAGRTSAGALPLPPLAALRAPSEASNNWAVGGARTATGRAYVANDPHLRYRVPDVWYLVDLSAPGLHVAGAALPGVPGVVLGHNDHIAWGATNATVSTVTVYREPKAAVREAGSETIAVRFASPVKLVHRATRHGFVFFEDDRAAYSAAWVNARERRSPLSTFLALDRAASAADAMVVLRSYVGPPQNFVVGDDRGYAAYHMAGFVPNDGVWSTRVVDGERVVDAWHGYVPFDALPHVDPSRDAVVYTANNRVWGTLERYRLTDAFATAFRANRIGAALHKMKRATLDDFRRLQLDEVSLADRDVARALVAYVHSRPSPSASEHALAAALDGWDGAMSPGSHAATVAFRLRAGAVQRFANAVLGDQLGAAWMKSVGVTQSTGALLCALRSSGVSFAQIGAGEPIADPPFWSEAGRTLLTHPLHAFGITAFDPDPLPGGGDFGSPKVQTASSGQSFRAVWEPGAWERGGIVVPLGESGRPASPHYADEQAAYVNGALLGLPFGASFAPESSLELTPAPFTR